MRWRVCFPVRSARSSVSRDAYVVVQLLTGEGTCWLGQTTAGMQAYREGRYIEAAQSLEAALQEAQRFGPQDSRLATSLNNLTRLYDTQGKYGQAEPLRRRALAIAERTLGPEHPALGRNAGGVGPPTARDGPR